MKKRLIVLLFLVLLNLAVVNAAVDIFISEISYDPDGSEVDNEFVELYVKGDE